MEVEEKVDPLLMINKALEENKLLLSLEGGEGILCKVDDRIFKFKINEEWEISFLKSKEAKNNPYIAVVFKKVRINTRRGIEEAAACQRHVSTPDKKSYIEFILNYGHFEEETSKD